MLCTTSFPPCINKTFLQHVCYHDRHFMCKQFVDALADGRRFLKDEKLSKWVG